MENNKNIKKKKMVGVIHCLLNNAAKVYSESPELLEEDQLRKKMLMILLEKDIQIVQMPCPEFSLYGARRWGHVKDQFDNPFFKKHCRAILSPVLDELEEYQKESDFFEFKGIVGVDGSPSCGVDYTCCSKQCYGSFSKRNRDVNEDIASIKLCNDSGVFIEVIKEELQKRGLDIPLIGLFAKEPDKVMNFIMDL